jgi:hypothetical protein
MRAAAQLRHTAGLGSGQTGAEETYDIASTHESTQGTVQTSTTTSRRQE